MMDSDGLIHEQAEMIAWYKNWNDKLSTEVLRLEAENARLKDKDLMFERIWNTIKHWDIDTSNTGHEYHGVTGDDVRLIIDAVLDFKAAPPQKGE